MTVRGQPFDATRGQQLWWVKARRIAGVECRWHDLRHTFASRWVMDGGDLAALQKLLGHATIDQTMRYAHLADAGLSYQVARIDRLRAGKDNFLSV